MKVVPNNVKQLRGTTRPDREVVEDDLFDVLLKAPEPADWLNVHAQQYWRKVVPRLIKAKLLTEGDLEAFEMLCHLYGKIRAAEIAGTSLNAATQNQFRMYQAEFGLTPAGRSRMSQRGEGSDGKPHPGRFSKNRPRAR